jgi:hypothetical protein
LAAKIKESEERRMLERNVMDEQWLEKQRKSELKQRQKELRIEDFENARMR